MNDRVLEVTRRTTACWKLQEEQQRVGSYKQNDSVASSTCCKVAEEQERRRQDVITPHPTPPRPTPPHPTRASGPKTSLAGDPKKR